LENGFPEADSDQVLQVSDDDPFTSDSDYNACFVTITLYQIKFS